MKSILLVLAAIITLLIVTSCGGGGGGGESPQPKSVAVVSVSLTGTLPANTAISGAGLTLILPPNVTPLVTNGIIGSSVVVLSGTFAGGTQTPPVYTAATAGVLGKLKIDLVSAVSAGITQVGEVVTITLHVANGAAPSVSDFSINPVNVVDADKYNSISGMGATVTNVTLK